MKFSFRIGWLSLAAIAATVAGCSTEPKVPYHAGDENPPPFIGGPVSILLTNVDGFSARIEGTYTTADGTKHTVSGDLLGREGSLIFQPTSAVKGRRARSEGGTFFIWSTARHEGWVLSDPLQAYAPITEKTVPTNAAMTSAAAPEETINGHRCRRMEATVQSSDGSSIRATVWVAEDARHFPMRIATPVGAGEMLVEISNLRLELPQAHLFSPPDGFTKYNSPVTLLNELITRQSVLTKRDYKPIETDEPAGGGPVNNWRPTTPQ